ncbi:DUF5518 domain-containing protein [Haloquadratum walsbyi]|uniref:DUF5518 domain-containing protein n=1 Tax=Haloquadratum walsbyi J07HQW2 TaxID=1238425 RepID=U1NAT2_9EURY|nr:DUF5518 domain-containing protein [Haloquadratum walsbyi]ERG93935.1 MAG: hypothetical protein J07HQW2_00369 [Haloquadratum walsbyi J07HQW2]
MQSNSYNRSIPQVWRVAILGVIAALPATVIVNWFPYSEAGIGGGVMIIGSILAGGFAATRSVEPSAAGLRTGFLSGMIALSVFIITEGMTLMRSVSAIVFFLINVVMLLCASPFFGMIFGRVGGWIINAVAESRIKQAS